MQNPSILPEGYLERADGPAELVHMRQHAVGVFRHVFERGPQIQDWLRHQEVAEGAGQVASMDQVEVEASAPETIVTPEATVASLEQQDTTDEIRRRIAEIHQEAA